MKNKKPKGLFEYIINQVIKLCFAVLLIVSGLIFMLRADIGFSISIKQKPYIPSEKPFIESIAKFAKNVKTGYDVYKKF